MLKLQCILVIPVTRPKYLSKMRLRNYLIIKGYFSAYFQFNYYIIYYLKQSVSYFLLNAKYESLFTIYCKFVKCLQKVRVLEIKKYPLNFNCAVRICGGFPGSSNCQNSFIILRAGVPATR